MIVRLARLLRMAWQLSRHDALIPKEYSNRLPFGLRLLGQASRFFSQKSSGRPGERLANALETMGPAQIKFGQFLAGRPDFLGLEAAQDLSRLQDNLPPFPQKEAEAILESELKGPINNFFLQFGPSIAAASIAQVHKAQTSDGKWVAVKILRPNIEKQLNRDLVAFRLGASLAQKFVPTARRLEPVAFLAEMEKSLLRELDFRLEATALSQFRRQARKKQPKDFYFQAPEIDWQRSNRQILTMEWIDGFKPKTEQAVAEKVKNREKLAIQVTQGFLRHAFDDGFFHADMHPGNVLIDDQARPWLVDFGIMGRLSPAQRRYLAEILWAFISQDYTRSAQAHFEAGYVPPHHDIDEFALALQATGEPILGKTADQISMEEILLQLWDITARFDMHLRPELILLQKTLLQIEGLARLINPKHDLWAAARIVVADYMKKELGPTGLARRANEDMQQILTTARKLPDLVDNLNQMTQRMQERQTVWLSNRARLWLYLGISALVGSLLTYLWIMGG